MAKGKYEKWLEPDGLLLLEGWSRNGLTNEDIAKNMGITRETLRVWSNKYPAISAALKEGKEVADIKVENALYQRAVGYSYTETTKERIKNPETGEYELITTKEVTKVVVPDTTAQIFWLKNRRPDIWRDKQNVELSGKTQTEVVNPYANLTEEQLIKLAELGDKE